MIRYFSIISKDLINIYKGLSFILIYIKEMFYEFRKEKFEFNMIDTKFKCYNKI